MTIDLSPATLVLLLAALLVWWFVMLAEATLMPAEVWERTGRSQMNWLMVMLFLPTLGGIVYLVVARGDLKNAKKSLAREEEITREVELRKRLENPQD